ncbi:MAG: hypothetical protein A3K19_00295 [Lentisphaerae bacterium RIFOXYB12_FULL_65_16]|nr:MAG: hypothetical protein A3K18_34355 [Lentisphaerae bacterium RIFOXYA12_64_32]OGV85355.1 MAG: hypothetical protein A3K19_00295 [Lentisphaerae bacterium RIFOXYB12_FULL_65_16]
MSWYRQWRPYVSVGERRAKAQKEAAKMAKKGRKTSPVVIEGREIASTFWGKAWCDHIESFHDYENRLPRGRTYVRNGSVIDLQLEAGKVNALVMGSSLYKISVDIKTLPGKKWEGIKTVCSGKIASLVELLQGRLSGAVMEVMTHRTEGLFPLPGQMSFKCSCPDWAEMCKHVAAVLYGVGSRLDSQPELLFKLRGVDHMALIGHAAAAEGIGKAAAAGSRRKLAAESIADVFGIELDTAAVPAATARAPSTRRKPRTAEPRKRAGEKKTKPGRPAARSRAKGPAVARGKKRGAARGAEPR